MLRNDGPPNPLFAKLIYDTTVKERKEAHDLIPWICDMRENKEVFQWKDEECVMRRELRVLCGRLRQAFDELEDSRKVKEEMQEGRERFKQMKIEEKKR